MYNLPGSPFNLALVGSTTLTVNTANVPKGSRLWLVNDSPFTLNLAGDIAQGTSILHPAQYNREYPINPMQNQILITIIAGSAALSFSTLLHIAVLLPGDPSQNDRASMGASRYPFAQNFGFQPVVPNGGTWALSQRFKAAVGTAPFERTANSIILDTLDFNNVIFFDRFAGLNQGTSFPTIDFAGLFSDCGVQYGHGVILTSGFPGGALTTVGTPAGFAQTIGVGVGPFSGTQQVTMPSAFPSFGFPINPTAIEINTHSQYSISTTTSTPTTDGYIHFYLSPIMMIAVRVLNSAGASTTIQVQTVLSQVVQQTATFTAAVSTPTSGIPVNIRCGMKAISNTTGTYDIFVKYSNTTTLTNLPPAESHVFAVTLSAAFVSAVAIPNLAPGIGLAVNNIGPATNGWFLFGNEGRDSAGRLAPAIQINVP